MKPHEKNKSQFHGQNSGSDESNGSFGRVFEDAGFYFVYTRGQGAKTLGCAVRETRLSTISFLKLLEPKNKTER